MYEMQELTIFDTYTMLVRYRFKQILCIDSYMVIINKKNTIYMMVIRIES